MVRVEIIFPFQDKCHDQVDRALLLRIIGEIGEQCRGFRMSRVFGFWISDSGKSYPDAGWLLVSDTTLKNAEWFRQKEEEWRIMLNQEEMYLVIHLVERI